MFVENRTLLPRVVCGWMILDDLGAHFTDTAAFGLSNSIERAMKGSHSNVTNFLKF